MKLSHKVSNVSTVSNVSGVLSKTKLFNIQSNRFINHFTHSTHNTHFTHSKRAAFTLAETLITLGIIGVVAAITMPTLIQNYQKHATENKLKHVYSLMNQAIKMSEIDNGNIEDWEFPNGGNGEDILVFVKKYIAPYLKYTKLDKYETYADVYLNNGTILRLWNSSATRMLAEVFFDGINEKSKLGKNAFVFYLGSRDNADTRYYFRNSIKGFFPYDYYGSYVENPTLDTIKNADTYGCNNNANKIDCTLMIYLEGWKISDDYPW